MKLKSLEFSYDPQGRRIRKYVHDLQANTEFERRYAYDGSEIIAELDESNNVLARYTHSGLRTDDVLSVEITSSGVSRGLATSAGDYYYLKDGLGSVQAIADSTGNIIQRYVYSSFGKILKITDGTGLETSPIVKTSYTFTNREWDEESGLYYYRARYYDAHNGRFIQEDPDAGSLSSPASLNNRFGYVENNPFNAIDPSGAISLKIGSLSFSTSFKSIVTSILFPPAAIAKLFLSGQDSARLDNIVIASAAVIAAAIIAPEFAILAAASSAFKNRGMGGNFFDNLDQYTTDFGVAFGLSVGLNQTGLAFFNAPVGEAALGKSAITGVTIQYGREILRRSPKERRILTTLSLFGSMGPFAPLVAPIVEPFI